MNYADNGYSGRRSQSKEFDNNPSTLMDKTQEVADKLVDLKNLLIKYLPLHEVQPIILDCSAAFQASGSTLLLDEFVAAARRWVRFRASLDQLSFKEKNQKVSTVNPVRTFMPSFAYPDDITNKRYFRPPKQQSYIASDTPISPYKYKNPFNANKLDQPRNYRGQRNELYADLVSELLDCSFYDLIDTEKMF